MALAVVTCDRREWRESPACLLDPPNLVEDISTRREDTITSPLSNPCQKTNSDSTDTI